MPRKGQEYTDASHLLNFKSGIPSDLPSTSYTPTQTTETRKEYKKNNKKLVSQRQERQARDKLSSSFFLHASSSHSFVISRKQKERIGGLGLYKDDGNEADKVKDWGIVRIVKCFVPATGTGNDQVSSLTTCSICLDDFVAPRITQCGHLFCYPCLLRHFHTSRKGEDTTKDLMAKCPCCFHMTSQRDLRLVEFITVQIPNVIPNHPTVMEFRKLYRNRSAVTPFVPASLNNGAVKNTTKGTISIRLRTDARDLPLATEQDSCYSRFSYVDVDSYQDHFSNDIASLERELENIAEMYSNCAGSNLASSNSDKYYVSMALQVVQVEHANAIATAVEERRLQTALSKLYEKENVKVLPFTSVMVEDTAKEITESNECKDDSSQATAEKQPTSKGGFLPGTMYANDDTLQFYQATDGQLCFLSGFNLNCLSHEYAVKDPIFEAYAKKEGVNKELHDPKPPYPDVVKGRVIEVDHIHLTADVRNRMRCFSHLPLYTDITLVEIDINGNLAEATRSICKKEMDRRRKKRQATREAEKKAEREAKQKEDARIEDLKRGIQIIDPNDSFFHAAAAAAPLEDTNVFDTSDFAQFLPAAESNTTSPPRSRENQTSGGGSRKAISFSSICTTNSAFPGLDTRNASFFPSLTSSNEAFPSLSSSAGRPSTAPSANSSPWAGNSPSSTAKGKKGGKGKKVVLFSTGGKRGY